MKKANTLTASMMHAVASFGVLNQAMQVTGNNRIKHNPRNNKRTKKGGKR